MASHSDKDAELETEKNLVYSVGAVVDTLKTKQDDTEKRKEHRGGNANLLLVKEVFFLVL